MRAGVRSTGGPRELRFRTRDGDWRWLESAPNAVTDDSGALIGVVSVLRDVTERRAMEAALRRKTVEAEAAAVAKADFLANMSHEIRTPLTGVLGYAGLLDALDGLPAIARSHIGRIVASGQTLLAIVNDVLDFSKLEAGQIELDPQPFDPAAVLADAAELMRPQAAGKGLSIGIAAGDALPEVLVADSARLRQVLINLLGNAVKFTARGGITIAARHDPAQGRLRIAVSDTGIGVPAEQAERLFQRFYQVDGSSTRRFGGAGLGLAISRALVEAMGGAIGVESRAGEGSTFWFEVPAPVGTLALEIAGDEAEVIRIEPLKILLVDDVAANRELVGCMLAPFGIDIAEAANGLEAVEAAMRTRFDLVLMDLQMPGMDGLAATRAIRANAPLNRDAPILALSANVLAAQVDACRLAGMNDHVAKPINPKDLLTKIARWTEAGEAAATAETAGA
jgi:signal transduction histidine kinase/ActR/RegA family two-component response regulator